MCTAVFLGRNDPLGCNVRIIPGLTKFQQKAKSMHIYIKEAIIPSKKRLLRNYNRRASVIFFNWAQVSFLKPLKRTMSQCKYTDT